MKEHILHNLSIRQFEWKEQELVAYIRYTLEADVINLLSVQVPKPLEGKGIAAALTQAALEYAQVYHYKVIATCPYVQVYIERHPTYQELLVK